MDPATAALLKEIGTRLLIRYAPQIRKAALYLLAAQVAAAVALLVVLVVVLPGATVDASAAAPVSCTLPVGPADAPITSVDPEQTGNAATIISVGKGLGVPPYGWSIAIATALQESGLRNIDYGDRDSLGLFQQRDAWGPREARLDPAQAATMFYTGGQGGQPGLLDIPGWQQMTLTDAAQAVQVSAFPYAYARWETLAGNLVRALADVDPGTCAPLATGPWTTPLAKGTYTLTARFADSGGRWSSGAHTGLDFAAPVGTPIMAASAGRVVSAGPAGRYGNLTIIEHADGVTTYYAHQSAISVTPGQPVQPGQVIGAVGATGNVTGPHCHFEVRVQGNPIDPEPWLADHGAPA